MSDNYKLKDADVGEVIVLAYAAVNAGFNEIKLDSQHALEISKLAYESFELRENNKRLRDMLKRLVSHDNCRKDVIHLMSEADSLLSELGVE